MKTWHDASPLRHGVDAVFLIWEVVEVFVATLLRKAHLEAAECKGPGNKLRALITNYRCPVRQEQGRRQMEKGPYLARWVPHGWDPGLKKKMKPRKGQGLGTEMVSWVQLPPGSNSIPRSKENPTPEP